MYQAKCCSVYKTIISPIVIRLFIFFYYTILFQGVAPNVGVYAVWGIGGLKNVAQRNVKPDLLRTVQRY
jgi:hypothetical protein